MAQQRKYSTAGTAVGAAIEFLEKLAVTVREKLVDPALADKCQEQADNLYDYLARNLQRKSVRTETERKARNQSILLRGYQKRIAELEEKLLLIRVSTDLHERGLQTSGAPDAGGQNRRMKRRIDHLEAKLLIIRDLSDTNVGKRQNSEVPEKERQVHEARIRVDLNYGLNGRRKVNPEKVQRLQADLADAGKSPGPLQGEIVPYCGEGAC